MKSKFHTCKLCSCSKYKLKEHIKLIHNLIKQNYYDKYLKQLNERICTPYSKHTSFIRCIDSYITRCSTSCNMSDTRVKAKNEYTNIQKYSVKHKWKYSNIDSKDKLKVSSDEQFFMNELSKLNISYKYQYYGNDLYPYKCDFYLDKFNIWIELNISPFHDNHFYDSTNIDDIAQLELLKQKAKTSSWHESKMRIWLKDVEKRDTATQNNLNYVVLWSRKELEFYIKYLKEII